MVQREADLVRIATPGRVTSRLHRATSLARYLKPAMGGVKIKREKSE